MATGFLALLDDVAAIAKLAAASLDDTVAAAGKASIKAAGVVIDDAAVTPRYVHGFSPARELPIIGKIALGSLRNKLLYLLPAAIALSYFAAWAITPLLMLGGSYLCFEGAEKLLETLLPHTETAESPTQGDAATIERAMVSGAIRTDLILSGEIMAISLASVADKPIVEQAIVLAIVGVAITILVYGAVALIVKADDVGIAMARSDNSAIAGFGRGLVTAMPPLLALLASVGTAAMLWVGGSIVLHGLHDYGINEPGHSIDRAAEIAGSAAGAIGPLVQWFVGALGSGLIGVAIGGAIVGVLLLLPKKAAH